MGEAKFSYYNDPQARGEGLARRVRHPACLAVNRPWPARLMNRLFEAGGVLVLVLALRSLALSLALASRLCVLGSDCTDLSGCCKAYAPAATRMC